MRSEVAIAIAGMAVVMYLTRMVASGSLAGSHLLHVSPASSSNWAA